MQHRSSALAAVACSLVLLVAVVPRASAQQFTGTIQGIVQDATAAVIPGADVSVINVGTNEVRHVTTDRDGAYVAPQLKPGVYRVIVERTGFRTTTVDEIKIDVQQIRAVDVRLDIGWTAETVSVSATVQSVLARNAEPRGHPRPRFVPLHQRRTQRDERSDD